MEKIIDGLTVRYKKTGSGAQCAVILQGWGTDMKIYDTVAADISDAFTVYQVNLPGFSDSDEPEEPWNVTRYCDWFIDFMKELGITRTVLIGHSYGCRMMIRLASGIRSSKEDYQSGKIEKFDLPFEITQMVFIDGAGIQREKTPEQKKKVARYHRLRDFLHKPLVYYFFKEPVDIWMSQQGSADYRNASPMMKKCMVMAINEDLSFLLPEISISTLLVWGDKDTATPVADGQDMERLMQDAGLVVIPGAGHYSYIENPGLFKRILRSFFKLSAEEA